MKRVKGLFFAPAEDDDGRENEERDRDSGLADKQNEDKSAPPFVVANRSM